MEKLYIFFWIVTTRESFWCDCWQHESNFDFEHYTPYVVIPSFLFSGWPGSNIDPWLNTIVIKSKIYLKLIYLFSCINASLFNGPPIYTKLPGIPVSFAVLYVYVVLDVSIVFTKAFKAMTRYAKITVSDICPRFADKYNDSLCMGV